MRISKKLFRRVVISSLLLYMIFHLIFFANFFSSLINLPDAYPGILKNVKRTSNLSSLKARGSSFADWFKNLVSFKESSVNLDTITDAVFVFGATGKTGKEVVSACLDSGRIVIAATKNATKTKELMNEHKNNKNLIIKSGIDVTNITTFSSTLFKGVSQIISVIGPSSNNINYNSENVDYKGFLNILESFKDSWNNDKSNTRGISSSYKLITDFSTVQKKPWVRLDDIIMGGSSYSAWDYNLNSFQTIPTATLVSETATESKPNGRKESFNWNYSRWKGEVITDGGGFCGTILEFSPPGLDISGYDGLKLLVRGDGYRYKVRLRLF